MSKTLIAQRNATRETKLEITASQPCVIVDTLPLLACLLYMQDLPELQPYGDQAAALVHWAAGPRGNEVCNEKVQLRNGNQL